MTKFPTRAEGRAIMQKHLAQVARMEAIEQEFSLGSPEEPPRRIEDCPHQVLRAPDGVRWVFVPAYASAAELSHHDTQAEAMNAMLAAIEEDEASQAPE